MKNISSRLVGALIAIHFVLAYIAGLNIQPFEYMPGFIWFTIPVIAILCISFYRLEPLFKNYKYHSLGTKMSLTAKTPWVWALLALSTMFVVMIMWYGAQALKPIEEIPHNIIFNGDARMGNVLCCGACTLLYVASIIWLYKTLKMIWKR